MKKTQVALAALALVASTAALATEVKIGGVLDVGVGVASKNGTTGGTYIESGAYNDHSSIELDVSEDLGNGMKAYTSLGMGFNANGQSDAPGVGTGFNTANNGLSVNNNSLFNRQALVGLSGNFGSIQIGRQLSPFILTNVFMQNYNGMFGVGRMVLAGTGGTANAFFQDDAIQYTTPAINGFTGTLFTSTPNGTRGNSFVAGVDGDRYDAFAIRGPIGPINFNASYHNSKNTYSGWNMGGTMAVTDGITASAGYISTKAQGGVQVGSFNIGASIDVGGSNKVIVQHAQNDADTALRLSNIMIANALSKRTTVYAGFGVGSAGIGASIGTLGSTNGATSAANTTTAVSGASNTAMVVGVSHAF